MHKEHNNTPIRTFISINEVAVSHVPIGTKIEMLLSIVPTPRYHKILLPMGFGRLPLQRNCDLTSGLIFMSNDSNERGGMELDTA